MDGKQKKIALGAAVVVLLGLVGWMAFGGSGGNNENTAFKPGPSKKSEVIQPASTTRSKRTTQRVQPKKVESRKTVIEPTRDKTSRKARRGRDAQRTKKQDVKPAF